MSNNIGTRRELPIRNDFFSGGSNITGDNGALEDLINQLWEEGASVTYDTTHIWVNGTSGNDSNDGTENYPLNTLQAALDKLPVLIIHPTCIHMRGIFNNQGRVTIRKYVLADLLFDGGDGTIDVLVETIGTSGDATEIVKTGAGWTVDAYAGYWCKITDPTSPAYGQIRTIQGNTSDTITFMKNFSVDPWVASLKFTIVKPETLYTGTFSSNFTGIVVSSLCNNSGTITFQRFRIESTDSSNVGITVYENSRVQLSGLIVDNTNALISFYGCVSRTSFILKDPDTLSSSVDYLFGSISNNNTNFAHKGTVNIYYCISTFIGGIYAKKLKVLNCHSIDSLLSYGSRINGSGVEIIRSTFTTDNAIKNISGYAITKIENSASVGLLIKGSDIEMDGIEVNDSTSHGIEVDNSKLLHTGSNPLAGTGNAGAGCYVHSQSNVQIKNGTPPTITGTVGDVSLDSTTEESTWAAIDAGIAIDGATVGNNEFVVVKEV